MVWAVASGSAETASAILRSRNGVINARVKNLWNKSCADSLDLVCAGCALAQNRRACRLYSNNLYISLFAL